jgi:hypothetical protein
VPLGRASAVRCKRFSQAWRKGRANTRRLPGGRLLASKMRPLPCLRRQRRSRASVWSGRSPVRRIVRGCSFHDRHNGQWVLVWMVRDEAMALLSDEGWDDVTTLVMGLDHVEWDPRTVGEIADGIRRVRPLWLRAANFFDRTLEVLRRLERPQLVAWKLEFWGSDTMYEQVPASAGVDPAAYAEDLLGLGHHVMPYTFNSWGRDRLSSLAPVLKRRSVALLPIAQKRPVVGESRESLRQRLDVGPDELLVGCGGLFHPAKGIEEIVEGFLRGFAGPDAHLLCGLVVEDEDETAGTIWQRWEERFGSVGTDRLHLRVGPYGDWPWMCAFYQAVDVMLVNSVSDSWGRMVAEAVGFGVPTLVRRADCGTNHIAPGVITVDGFSELSGPEFAAVIQMARARAAELAAYVTDRYTVPLMRRLWLEVLREETPPEWRAAFDKVAVDPVSLAALDELIVY